MAKLHLAKISYLGCAWVFCGGTSFSTGRGEIDRWLTCEGSPRRMWQRRFRSSGEAGKIGWWNGKKRSKTDGAVFVILTWLFVVMEYFTIYLLCTIRLLVLFGWQQPLRIFTTHSVATTTAYFCYAPSNTHHCVFVLRSQLPATSTAYFYYAMPDH